jgi:hypothetical protein
MNRVIVLLSALALVHTATAQERPLCRVVLPAPDVKDAVDAYLVFPAGSMFPTLRGAILQGPEDSRFAVFEVPADWAPPGASLTVREQGGDWHFVPVASKSLQLDDASCAEKSAVLKLARQAREQLHEAVARRDDAKAALERLKADVDVIGNINRIVGTEQLLEGRQWELTRASEVEKSLVYKSAQLSRQTVPKFQHQRTANLQRYAAAAAKASSPGAKDTAELQAASSAMAEKLALIESTKGEHMTLLTRELARLKREREALEDALGFTVE